MQAPNVEYLLVWNTPVVNRNWYGDHYFKVLSEQHPAEILLMKDIEGISKILESHPGIYCIKPQ